MSQGVPVRTVRYPWGDVPYELAAEWDNSIMFHTEVDCTVDSHIYTSLESGDDPTYAQAMRGPERQQWVDAREDEMNALRDLGVIVLTPADAVPLDEDIYDTMALCKRKRGELSPQTQAAHCAVWQPSCGGHCTPRKPPWHGPPPTFADPLSHGASLHLQASHWRSGVPAHAPPRL